MDIGIEDKKNIVIETYKLGMDKEDCYLLAKLSDLEIEKIEKDREFQKQLAYILKAEEKRLLLLQNKTIIRSSRKGNSKPIEWKLEKINGNKWGNKQININKNISSEVTLSEDDRKRIEKEFNYLFKEKT